MTIKLQFSHECNRVFKLTHDRLAFFLGFHFKFNELRFKFESNDTYCIPRIIYNLKFNSMTKTKIQSKSLFLEYIDTNEFPELQQFYSYLLI